MGQKVEPLVTPIEELQLAIGASKGYEKAFGSTPKLTAIGCAWAQLSLETGRGKHCYHYNVGNITAFGWDGDSYELITKERVRRNPDHWEERSLKYRVYKDLVEGCEDYWKLLARKYAPVLSMFSYGKPDLAAFKLSELCYYTARPEPYAKAMSSLYDEFFRRFKDDPELTAGNEVSPDVGFSRSTEQDLEAAYASSLSTLTDMINRTIDEDRKNRDD